MPDIYCHPGDVLSLASSLFETDTVGRVISDNFIRHAIMVQSGIVRSYLRDDYPDLHNVDFWQSPAPIASVSNNENKNATISLATLSSDLGMDFLRLWAPADQKISITRGITGDLLVDNATWATTIDEPLVSIPSGAFSTGKSDNGDVWYIGGYTCDPLIVLITATLVVCAEFRKSFLKQNAEAELEVIRDMYRGVMGEAISGTVKPKGLLPQLRDKEISMGGIVHASIGQWLHLPAFVIDRYGVDITEYNTNRSGNPQMY